MYADELLKELLDAGVPIKEAVRQAKAHHEKRQRVMEDTRREFNRNKRRPAAPNDGWGNGR